MEPMNPNPVDITQIAIAKKLLDLENQIKGGIGWFFWIAGLSLLNSVIFFMGSSITFVVGLGVTQFVDGFASALANEFSSGAAVVVRLIGFGLNLFIAGIFALCGVFGRKRIKWVIITGMVFYAFDGLLSLAFRDWFGAFFHVWALTGLLRGFKAINSLTLLEKSQSNGDIAAIQSLIAIQPARDPGAERKNLIRFAAIIGIPAVLVLTLLLFFILTQPK